ncbi:MAG TPA: ATP-binding protein [Desulfomonilaceae bacterium]|nr:ATP-binding protein [Desulfomonilaceae bacterium]
MAQEDLEKGLQERPYPLIYRKPDWLEIILAWIEKRVPRFFKPKTGFLFSIKNRILIGTLSIVVGGVFFIGIILQLTVFPKLRGDPSVILNLKIIHFVVSVIVIAVSCLFIELISKKITRPLVELTKRADHISREAGGPSSPTDFNSKQSSIDTSVERESQLEPANEITQLTSSFNRMIAHLTASQARLKESQNKYRFLFDNGPFPIFVLNTDDMRIVDVNARAEEEYGYSREQLLRLSFMDLGLDQQREFTSGLLKELVPIEPMLVPTEGTLHPVLLHKRRDGSKLKVNFHARLSRYRGRPAIIAAVWDITEKLEKHAMLIQAGKMATVGEMATGIAHELNQPLNVLRLGCDYLVKKTKTGMLSLEDLTSVTTELTAGVQRASRIINHLREFGRKSDEIMTAIDINQPIRNVFTLLGTQLSAREIRWDLDLEENLPPVMGDANRLEQVFINLVLNARDAVLAEAKRKGPDGKIVPKMVTVRSFLQDERVVITVADTGPGVSESLKLKVFEPFFTTKESGEGTGLGLSISYGIIKEHRGTIEVDTGQTGGALFRMTLPVLKR